MASKRPIQKARITGQTRSEVRTELRTTGITIAQHDLELGDRVSLKVGKRAMMCRVVRMERDEGCGDLTCCYPTYYPVLGKGMKVQ